MSLKTFFTIIFTSILFTNYVFALEKNFGEMLKGILSSQDKTQVSTSYAGSDVMSYGTCLVTACDKVEAFQKILLANGLEVSVNGRFDRQTEEAVKAYQIANGLSVTGEADQNLLDKLKQTTPESVVSEISQEFADEHPEAVDLLNRTNEEKLPDGKDLLLNDPKNNPPPLEPQNINLNSPGLAPFSSSQAQSPQSGQSQKPSLQDTIGNFFRSLGSGQTSGGDKGNGGDGEESSGSGNSRRSGASDTGRETQTGSGEESGSTPKQRNGDTGTQNTNSNGSEDENTSGGQENPEGIDWNNYKSTEDLLVLRKEIQADWDMHANNLNEAVENEDATQYGVRQSNGSLKSMPREEYINYSFAEMKKADQVLQEIDGRIKKLGGSVPAEGKVFEDVAGKFGDVEGYKYKCDIDTKECVEEFVLIAEVCRPGVVAPVCDKRVLFQTKDSQSVKAGEDVIIPKGQLKQVGEKYVYVQDDDGVKRKGNKIVMLTGEEQKNKNSKTKTVYPTDVFSSGPVVKENK